MSGVSLRQEFLVMEESQSDAIKTGLAKVSAALGGGGVGVKQQQDMLEELVKLHELVAELHPNPSTPSLTPRSANRPPPRLVQRVGSWAACTSGTAPRIGRLVAVQKASTDLETGANAAKAKSDKLECGEARLVWADGGAKSGWLPVYSLRGATAAEAAAARRDILSLAPEARDADCEAAEAWQRGVECKKGAWVVYGGKGGVGGQIGRIASMPKAAPAVSFAQVRYCQVFTC